MKLLDFLNLCNPYTLCLIFNKSTNEYICVEVKSVYFLLTHFDLSNFVVNNFYIDTYEALDDYDDIDYIPYLSIDVVEV